jgi:hypothetical protein
MIVFLYNVSNQVEFLDATIFAGYFNRQPQLSRLAL